MRNETLRVRVSETLRQRLEAIAQARDLDLSDIVREACNDYLASKSGTILAEHGSGYHAPHIIPAAKPAGKQKRAS